MSKPNQFFFAAFLALVGFHATPASAVGNAAYLSHTGSSGPCTLAAPCNSMSLALTAAGVGGEVICLDKGSYGQGNISQSVTISCGDGFWETPAVTINITTPAGADVVIEGLVSDGLGSSGTTMSFTGQGSLRLRRVRIGNDSGSVAHGLNFVPSGGATLNVSDSIFYNNGGSGINVRPTGSGYANVHIRNTKFERNANGLFVDGSASSIGINVNISESMAVENQGNGIGAYSPAGGAPVTVSVKDSHISGNLTNGIGALGATASGAGSVMIAVGNSMITANVNGVSTGGAAQIRTHGNNQLLTNSNNGVFTSNVGLQ
jgi:hypothetical protein